MKGGKLWIASSFQSIEGKLMFESMDVAWNWKKKLLCPMSYLTKYRRDKDKYTVFFIDSQLMAGKSGQEETYTECWE